MHAAGVDASHLFRTCLQKANKPLKDGDECFTMPDYSLYKPYKATEGKVAGLFTNAGDAALLVHQVAAPLSKSAEPAETGSAFSDPLDASQFSSLVRSAQQGLAPVASRVHGERCAEVVKMARAASHAAARVYSIHKPAAAVIHDPCTFMPVAWVRT